ncbi:hypothetical protein BGZ80_008555, partial [Entomortierella chlamydospora]
MATEGDPYLLIQGITFDSRDLLDRYLDAVQKVVDRHDIFRTAIMWESLTTPAQVVLRQVPLPITELSLEPATGPIGVQLNRLFDPRKHRMDLTQAPLMRYAIAQDIDGRWIAVQLLHHLIGDHSTLELMMGETKAIINDQRNKLHNTQPFRNLIAQVRSGPSARGYEAFFTNMLSEIDTPALPYGLSDVRRDGIDVIESHLALPHGLNSGLRSHAKRMG